MHAADADATQPASSARASAAPGSDTTLDAEEVRRFSRIAAEWWDPNGKFRPLHQIGPPRLTFVGDQAAAHFSRDPKSLRPLVGLTAVDIGCGGGLVSEPLARMGARVTGIDPSERNIAIAKGHAEPQSLAIDYRAARVEDLAAEDAPDRPEEPQDPAQAHHRLVCRARRCAAPHLPRPRPVGEPVMKVGSRKRIP